MRELKIKYNQKSNLDKAQKHTKFSITVFNLNY